MAFAFTVNNGRDNERKTAVAADRNQMGRGSRARVRCTPAHTGPGIQPKLRFIVYPKGKIRTEATLNKGYAT